MVCVMPNAHYHLPEGWQDDILNYNCPAAEAGALCAEIIPKGARKVTLQGTLPQKPSGEGRSTGSRIAVKPLKTLGLGVSCLWTR